jgi:prepilin-type N-terminal cleavage/methylation domain-containing protein/prepilin-type processing-associated H-X9-DG protein
MTLRRRGFTLIELLVVIAIIGILAAMLFPVFARAREAARKIQCLANVKNLAISIQMYLVDYDRLWPTENRPEVIAGSHPSNPDSTNSCALSAGTGMNPYLQPPVILDEYIKNRDVWTCPSARNYGTHGITNPEGMDWWARVNLVDPNDWGSYAVGQCSDPYPPGWGGRITDSIIQDGEHADGPGAFTNSLNVIEKRNVSTSQMTDPARFVVCGESSLGTTIDNPVGLAYPDAYAMCGANPGSVICCDGNWVYWDNCSWSQDCGADHFGNYSDTEFRKKNAYPRHLGGSNVGFADGHAKWYNSEAILSTYAPDSEWRADGLLVCYGVTPTVAQERKNRQGLWDGFEYGICQMWGAFGLKPSCE